MPLFLCIRYNIKLSFVYACTSFLVLCSAQLRLISQSTTNTVAVRSTPAQMTTCPVTVATPRNAVQQRIANSTRSAKIMLFLKSLSFFILHTSYLLKEPIFFSFWRSPFHGYTITQPFSFVKFKESKCHIGIFDNEKGGK